MSAQNFLLTSYIHERWCDPAAVKRYHRHWRGTLALIHPSWAFLNQSCLPHKSQPHFICFRFSLSLSHKTFSFFPSMCVPFSLNITSKSNKCFYSCVIYALSPWHIGCTAAPPRQAPMDICLWWAAGNGSSYRHSTISLSFRFNIISSSTSVHIYTRRRYGWRLSTTRW